MTACRHGARMVARVLEDPARPDDAHLLGCPACADAVRGALSFESALRGIVPSLVTEALPPAYRLGVDRRATERTRGIGNLAAHAPMAIAALGVTAALTLGLVLRFAPAMPPGVVGGAPAGSPAAVGAAPSLRASDAPASAASRPPVSPSPTHDASSPGVSLSPACVDSFAVAVKVWATSGLPPFAGSTTDRKLVLRTASILSKAFAVCSADELRKANAKQTISYAVKVAEGGTVRHVWGSVLGSFDGAVPVLCVESTLVATRACTTYAGAPPGASRSP